MVRLFLYILSAYIFSATPFLTLEAQPYHGGPSNFIEEFIVDSEQRFDENEKAIDFLEQFGPEQLWKVRNAILAEKGHVFRDTVLQDYFEEQGWYEKKGREIDLSPVDEANIELLRSMEKDVQKKLPELYERYFPPCDPPIDSERLEKEFVDEGGVKGMIREYPFRTMALGQVPPPQNSVSQGCTIDKGKGHRVLFHFQFDNNPMGGLAICRLIALDDEGKVLSEQELFHRYSTKEDRWTEADEARGDGKVRIDEEGNVKVEETTVRLKKVDGKMKKSLYKKEWSWYRIEDGGRIVELPAE